MGKIKHCIRVKQNGFRSGDTKKKKGITSLRISLILRKPKSNPPNLTKNHQIKFKTRSIKETTQRNRLMKRRAKNHTKMIVKKRENLK